MINIAGELYVISEKDVTTGERTNYYKCGIVREGSDRNTRERLFEHQTGNPRRLFVVETFLAPSVEFVETSIHHRWATKRVSGEWFKLDEGELALLLESIQSFISEVASCSEVFAAAAALKDNPSNGLFLAPSDDARHWFSQYSDYKVVSDKCEELIASYQGLLRKVVASGVDISSVATPQKRAASKKFNEQLFEEKYPEIYRTYTQVESQVSGQFRFTPNKDVPNISEVLSTGQCSIIGEFETLLNVGDESLDHALELHAKYLTILEIRNYASWQCEIAKAQLQVITGDNDGIESICSWKRKRSETRKFNRVSAQKEFPSEYETCAVEGKGSEAMVIKPMQPEL